MDNDRYTFIDDMPYSIGNIEPKLQSKINRLFKKYEKIVEICPKNYKEKIELIKNTVGHFAINKMKNHARFYKCKSITECVQRTKRITIPDINDKCGNIFRTLIENDIKIFLHGGIIRDYFLGVPSTDIDIVFDTNVHKLKNICNDNNWPCLDIRHKSQYINFGENKGVSLEGSNFNNSLLADLHLREASVNDFAFDLKNNILIDLTGFGLQDILFKKIRLSAPPKYFSKWATEDFKKPLRYFKLIQKGFKPLNDSIHNFVVKYIEDNYDSVYDKPLYADVTRIKHFLIKNITQGDIDIPTGNYTFGANKNKLIPYLSTIKKHLSKEIFAKIISNFNKDDLKKLKETSIVSSLKKYMKLKDTLELVRLKLRDIKKKRKTKKLGNKLSPNKQNKSGKNKKLKKLKSIKKTKKK